MIITLNTEANLLEITKKTVNAQITGIDQTLKKITVTPTSCPVYTGYCLGHENLDPGDITVYLDVNSRINVYGSTGNDRSNINVGYTVVRAELGDGVTEIIVKEDIPSSVADGDVQYFAGLCKTDVFAIDGDETGDLIKDKKVEIIDACDANLDKVYTVVASSYDAVADVTYVQVAESINFVYQVYDSLEVANNFSTLGFVLYFNSGDDENSFIIKSPGSAIYSLYPRSANNSVSKMGTDIIKVSIGTMVEYFFKYDELVLTDDTYDNIDEAIVAIFKLINPANNE